MPALQVNPQAPTPGHDVIVVGASAGGIPAIRAVLAGLPKDLPASVLIVLHTAPEGGDTLPRIFARGCPLPLRFAEDGQPLRHGEAYIAQPDCHLLLEPGAMRVVHGPRENRFRPAVDPLFRSAAWAYGPRVLGVLLSGLMQDGSAGLWAIKTCGGTTIVQEPSDAQFSDMPLNALQQLPVDHRLPAADIGPLLGRLAREPARGTVHAQTAEQLKIETQMTAQTDHRDIGRMNQIGTLSPFTCPSCHGALWQVHDEHVLRFRCHTGHGFSADSLDVEQEESYETALFGALRALEENARLARVLAERSRDSRRDIVAKLYEDKANADDRSATVIRDMLHKARATGTE
jgi:two-component system chemotaxis response regulator CheB